MAHSVSFWVLGACFALLSTATPSMAADRPRMFYADPTGGDTKDPSVVKFKGQYFLYYSISTGPNKPWLVGIATSANLLDWKHAVTMKPETPAEAKGFCAPGARVIDGRVHLFYQSYGGGKNDAILHAVSDDGLHFERDASSPVFHPAGDWTCGRAIDAEVYPVGDKLMMYYATRDPAYAIQLVGIASAPLNSKYSKADWTQITQNAAEAFRPTVPTATDAAGLDLAWEQKCIEAPTLLTHKGLHYLFYAGAYNNSPQQIGVAVSEDGIRFKRMNGGKPLLGPGPAGSWNAAESGHPGVFQDDDGRDYLFYQGDNPPAGIKWHLSMVPIRWQADPAGGPDVPTLDFNDPKLK